MSTVIFKKEVFTSIFFDGTIAPASYLTKCTKNAGSPTGYYYGTMNTIPCPDCPSLTMIDGCAIPEKCYLIFKADSGALCEVVTPADYTLRFQPIQVGA